MRSAAARLCRAGRASSIHSRPASIVKLTSDTPRCSASTRASAARSCSPASGSQPAQPVEAHDRVAAAELADRPHGPAQRIAGEGPAVPGRRLALRVGAGLDDHGGRDGGVPDDLPQRGLELLGGRRPRLAGRPVGAARVAEARAPRQRVEALVGEADVEHRRAAATPGTAGAARTASSRPSSSPSARRTSSATVAGSVPALAPARATGATRRCRSRSRARPAGRR